MSNGCTTRRLNGAICLGSILLSLFLTQAPATASENVPHRPFAEWANLPKPGQLVAGIVYQESEAYHIWAGREFQDVTVKSGGESYGIDINQGFLTFQYGITEKWAADFNLGFTTMGWRAFDLTHSAESTTGLMDWSFGVRYQIFHEADGTNPDNDKMVSPWTPTLTFRAGAVLPGTYAQDIEFAPGVRSAAIEPELLLRKHFGWTGFGGYADALYRWNRTTGNDQYIVAAGFFQQIQRWELDLGYRHLQTISGGDMYFRVPGVVSSLVYPRDVREISDALEAGFSYTTSKHHLRYAFECRTILDGSNTDQKFWVGGSLEVPFDLFR
jgi:hypothetical protein